MIRYERELEFCEEKIWEFYKNWWEWGERIWAEFSDWENGMLESKKNKRKKGLKTQLKQNSLFNFCLIKV